MRAFASREVYRSEGYEIRVVGGPPFAPRDVYHWLLRVPWCRRAPGFPYGEEA